MKKLFLFLAISYFTNIVSSDNSETLRQIQSEYQSLLTSQDLSKAEAVQVNQTYNPTLCNVIINLMQKMEIKANIFAVIFKGNEATKKTSERFGADMRLNAFANGLSENAMILSIGEELLTKLTFEELHAIIAHELGHIKFMHPKKKFYNLIGTNLIDCFAGLAVGLLANKYEVSMAKKIGLVALYSLSASTISILRLMSVSRSCEFEADAFAAKFIPNKKDLITGVAKIERMCSDNYYKSSLARLFNKFSTHPLIVDRETKLQII